MSNYVSMDRKILTSKTKKIIKKYSAHEHFSKNNK